VYLLGFLAALLVGLGLAAILEYRDSSLRTEDDVVDGLGMLVLATIAVLESHRSGPAAQGEPMMSASMARDRSPVGGGPERLGVRTVDLDVAARADAGSHEPSLHSAAATEDDWRQVDRRGAFLAPRSQSARSCLWVGTG